ncbi:unnamed protein product [Chrysoparadoxa australica]
MTKENQGTWDTQTQTFHGGQDWKFCEVFVEDFSVTTNGLGTPAKAKAAAAAAVDKICHYPPSDFEPAISDLSQLLWVDNEKAAACKPLMLLGNGASELIDLVIRQAKPGSWRPGPQKTQYKEYQRSAEAAGFSEVSSDDRGASLMCLVNPTNPTGDYWSVPEVKAHIETTCAPDTTVIVDESMQPWLGAHWRDDSLIQEREWARKLSEEKRIHVWIMTSWTKIWSCTGVRLGSVVAPTLELAQAVKRKQVPWSVNVMALEFLSEVVKDTEYMEKTWALTTTWNKETRAELTAQHPGWEIFGKDFLSWLWIDTKDAAVSAQACKLAKAAGVPLRSGAPGYNLPTFFRTAVRSKEQRQVRHLTCPEPRWRLLC